MRVEVERVVEAPRETVFARYTDHAGWSDWAGVGKVSLARDGAPERNGVGCVRHFESAMGLQEQVIEFEPPAHMAYRIVRGGFPIREHRGDVRFESHPRGTRIVWSVEFHSGIPFTGWVLARSLERVFRVFLSRFERRALAVS
jgi:uncharacterized protein YndB with AHSA1/START domain